MHGGNQLVISVHFLREWSDGSQLLAGKSSAVVASSDHPSLEREARQILSVASLALPIDPLWIQTTPISAQEFLWIQRQGGGFLLALVDVLDALGWLPSRDLGGNQDLLAIRHELDHLPLHEPFEHNIPILSTGGTWDTLSRRFQKFFDITPRQYFEHRRRLHALRLLRLATSPIKEIAGDLGFTNLADFSAWFKRFQGVSPRAYRSAAGSEKPAAPPEPALHARARAGKARRARVVAA